YSISNRLLLKDSHCRRSALVGTGGRRFDRPRGQPLASLVGVPGESFGSLCEGCLEHSEPRTLNACLELPALVHDSPSRKRTALQHLGYDALRVLCRATAVWLYGLRVMGRENWPA